MLDIIKQRRMMQLALAILVILNLGLMGSMVLNKRPSPESEAPRQGLEMFLKEELALSENQMEALHDIRKQHFDWAQPLMEALADSLETLVGQAFYPVSDSVRVNELAHNISDLHVSMDLALYTHFVQLNAICTPEQQDRLKDLAGKLMPGSSRPPHPKEQMGEGRPPHPDGQGMDRRPPPPSGGPGSGGPPPHDR